jgi:uncharacterized protein (DUF1800 family)
MNPGRGLRVLAALVLGAALTVGTALAAEPLGDRGARQLLTRAGFAPNAVEVAALAPLTQAQAVDRLLAGAQRTARTTAPDWLDERIMLPRELQRLSDEERRAYRQKLVRQSLRLRGWWLAEMAATDSPLTERMTLFWHNHFVSAQPKVLWPQLLYRQNALFREHALGSFAALLHAIARDPAMLVYLDGASSRRGQPNENFARELMELFTLGQGQYGEADVREAARAFTGHGIDPDSGGHRFRPRAHDSGDKTIFGRTAAFDSDGVLDLLLAQPATAGFIVDKLWREFVSPQPDPARVGPIAEAFRRSGFSIAVAVRALLNQPEAVSPDPALALVKSPVELLIGLVRQSGGRLNRPEGAALVTAALGQNLFGAPNVRGWPGGEAWINTQTLVARKQFLERALAPTSAPMPAATTMDGGGDEPSGERQRAQWAQAAMVRAVDIDAARWLEQATLAPERPLDESSLARLPSLIGTVPPVDRPVAGTLTLDALRALLLDPAYQLK